MRLRYGAAILGLVASFTAAGATTIDFNNANSGNLTTYTESGYTVQNASGRFNVSTFGDPGPSIYTITSSSITVTGPSLFTFTSVDLVNDQSSASYVISGFNGLTQLFSIAGAIPTAPGGSGASYFAAYGTGYSAFTINKLQIAINGNSIDTNVDNINLGLAATPEPSSLVLLATGLLGLATVFRRRSA